MTKKRILAFLCAIMMLVTLFAACGDPKDPVDSSSVTTTGGSTTSSSSGTTVTTTEDPFDLKNSSTWDADQWLAYEQQLDFDGYEFTFFSTELASRMPKEGDPTQLDAEWRENLEQLKEDLNIDIIYDNCPRDDSAILYSWIMSGDNPADFYDIKTHTWFPLYAKNALVKLNSADILAAGLDVNNEQLLYQDFTHAWDIQGDTYAVRYASKYNPAEAGWVMFFNKQLVKDAGVENIYQVVRDGKWTWDYFLDLATKITTDTDNDGNMDIWGIATGYLGFGEEVLLAGGKIVDWVDGKLTSMINSPEALEAYTFMDRVSNSGNIMLTPEGTVASYKEGHLAFKAGKVGLLWSEMSRARRELTGSTALALAEIAWGTLPTPKSSESSEYGNILGGVNYDVMFISNKNQATSAAIYAAFARRQNNPDILDSITIFLQEENDTDSLDMIQNYIFSKPVANWSWCSIPHNDTYRSEVVYKIFDDNATPTSLVEAAQPKLQALLDDLSKTYN